MKAQSHGKRQRHWMTHSKSCWNTGKHWNLHYPAIRQRRWGYEENGRVYSSQLAFFHRLLTGQWQKVAVTRRRFMKH
jgi:type IV secretion system protein VirB4